MKNLLDEIFNMMQEKTSFDANYSLEGEFVVVDHLERCWDQISQDYPI